MISRRDALLLLCASPLAFTGCRTPATFERPNFEFGAIDIHSHIFNGLDVPVTGFLTQVVLRDSHTKIRDRPFLEALIELLAAILTRSTETPEQELRRISRGGIPTPDIAFTLDVDAEDERIVAEAIGAFQAEIGVFQVSPADGSPSQGDQAVLARLYEDTGVSPVSPVTENSIPKNVELAAAIYERSAETGRYVRKSRFLQAIRWAGLLTRPRSAILREYVALYGGPNGVQVVCPSILDFTFWFLEDEPVSGRRAQIDVMSAIAKQSQDVLVLNFVGFCPLRAAVERRRGLDPLRLVKRAILERGFAGIKLYPPMGFKPIGNNPDDTYGQKPERKASGAELDRELNALYSWCTRLDIDAPIKAHAANGNAAQICSGQNAAPDNWSPVLAIYPNLRLNLAHFGGFDETNPDEADNICRDKPPNWEERVVDLFSGDHQYTYSDLGYWTEIYEKESARRTRGLTRRLLRQSLELKDRLMFGTDWTMLGREPKHPEYIAALHRAAADLKIPVQALFRDNARAYLGLDQATPARGRLEAFFGPERLDAALGPIPTSPV
jgi:predicted TIM-barrel fold metal-dependent hydrolase